MNPATMCGDGSVTEVEAEQVSVLGLWQGGEVVLQMPANGATLGGMNPRPKGAANPGPFLEGCLFGGRSRNHLARLRQAPELGVPLRSSARDEPGAAAGRLRHASRTKPLHVSCFVTELTRFHLA